MLNLKAFSFISVALALTACGGSDDSSCNANGEIKMTMEQRLDYKSSSSGLDLYETVSKADGGVYLSVFLHLKDGRSAEIPGDELDVDLEGGNKLGLHIGQRMVSFVGDDETESFLYKVVTNPEVSSKAAIKGNALEVAIPKKHLKGIEEEFASNADVKVCSTKTKVFVMGGEQQTNSKSLLFDVVVSAQFKNTDSAMAEVTSGY